MSNLLSTSIIIFSLHDTMSQYISVDTAMTWTEAEDYCESQYDSNLATIITGYETLSNIDLDSGRFFGLYYHPKYELFIFTDPSWDIAYDFSESCTEYSTDYYSCTIEELTFVVDGSISNYLFCAWEGPDAICREDDGYEYQFICNGPITTQPPTPSPVTPVPTTHVPTTSAPTTKIPTAVPTTPDPTTPAPTLNVGQYIIVDTAMSWTDAEEYCESTFGTHLATIITDEDKDALPDTVYSGTYYFGLYYNPDYESLFFTSTAEMNISYSIDKYCETWKSAYSCDIDDLYFGIDGDTTSYMYCKWEGPDAVCRDRTDEESFICDAPVTTLSPTPIPTTSNPTTSNPTTSSPTAMPSTANPTSIPSTASPTTARPTPSPTTRAPTTAVPTSSSGYSARTICTDWGLSTGDKCGWEELPQWCYCFAADKTWDNQGTKYKGNVTFTEPVCLYGDMDGGYSECPNPGEGPRVSASPTSPTAPTTPTPTTPSPTTPSPTTPAPITSIPTTSNPTTPAPVTPIPTTPNPTTSSPTRRPRKRSSAPTSAPSRHHPHPHSIP